LLPWPQRLTTPPPRLEELGISSNNFSEDNVGNCMILQYKHAHLSDGNLFDIEILLAGDLAF